MNGAPNVLYPHSKLNYLVHTNGKMPVVEDDIEMTYLIGNGQYISNLANDQVELMKKAENVTSVAPFISFPAGVAPPDAGEWVFPLDTANFKWNRDNFGPMAIPKEGVTVEINPKEYCPLSSHHQQLRRQYPGGEKWQDHHKWKRGQRHSTFKMDLLLDDGR
jgi:signal peptidase I